MLEFTKEFIKFGWENTNPRHGRWRIIWYTCGNNWWWRKQSLLCRDWDQIWPNLWIYLCKHVSLSEILILCCASTLRVNQNHCNDILYLKWQKEWEIKNRIGFLPSMIEKAIICLKNNKNYVLLVEVHSPPDRWFLLYKRVNRWF